MFFNGMPHLFVYALLGAGVISAWFLRKNEPSGKIALILSFIPFGGYVLQELIC